MKIYTIPFFTLFIASVFGQQSATLNVNNVNTQIFNSMSPFFDETNLESTLEIGIGNNPIFMTGLTLLGLDYNDSIFISSQGLKSTRNEYGFGPISNNYSINSFEQYDRVWKVTSQELWAHQQGLGTSSAILTWPAHGDVSNGEAFYLAPFIDVNHDGIYNPSDGDYPKIKGDEAVYYIMNDKNSDHTAFNNRAIGVEVHVMIYGFSSGIHVINNTLFVNYSIYNRSNIDFSEFYISPFLDADILCAHNDIHGGDSTRNTVFTFENSPDNTNSYWSCQDTNYSSSGVAIKHLNRDLYSSFLFNSSQFYIFDTNYPNIFDSERVYNIMNGKNVFGESSTSFIDSSLTNFITPNGISDLYYVDTINSSGYDAKANSVVKLNSFSSNSDYCFDLAYVYYQNDTLDNIENAIGLLYSTDTVQTFYDNVNLSCVGFLTDKEELNSSYFKITSYPNPAIEKVILTFSKELVKAEICIQNPLGQEVIRVSVHNESEIVIERNGLERGVYFYSVIENKAFIGSGKLIFQ